MSAATNQPAANDPIAPPKPPRFLRSAEVIQRVGLGRSAIYARIRANAFPKQVDLGGVSVWVESEIDAWIAARIAERNAEDKVA